MRWLVAACVVLLGACGPVSSPATDDQGGDRPAPEPAFPDRVVSFTPGENAGFGQNKMPGVVLGPPQGRGTGSGSLDVVSLGREGEIVLAFDSVYIVDGDGPDLIVFENPFVGFVETGFVAASEDGETWHEWPCQPDDVEGGYPGCAGVRPVFSSTQSGISPADVERAGGDAFDLADLGLTHARFVRIRDSGKNMYEGQSGGFDLDAVVAIHHEDVGG